VIGRLASGALAAALAIGSAGPFGLDWPDRLDWGERLELSDLRRLLDLHPPVWIERGLYNPRERTERALERLAAADPEGALEAFETAGRIAPDDPRVLYGLGTGRLLADHGDAVGALERALGLERPEAEEPSGREPLPAALRQSALYNLGNARLAARDNAGAVTAFEEALRLDPADQAAKFNLELALRRLAEERLRLRSPQEAPGGKQGGEEEPSDRTGGTEPDAEPEAGPDEAGREPESSGPEAGSDPREGAPFGRRPLAGFEEQDDLTAAQAAALLEAVENLERRQRQVEATRAARQAGAEEEDW
jgi:tetratricopeptide (TPR) repeat protein